MIDRFKQAKAQAREYQKYWHQPSPEGQQVYISMGDSTGLGVGSADPHSGYVGLIARQLEHLTGKSVRTINFCISGERAADMLRRQIPRLEREPAPDFLTCVIGANDVVSSRRWRQKEFKHTMEQIAAALPSHAILGLVPSFGFLPLEYRVRSANEAITEVAAQRQLAVADLYSVTRDLWPRKIWRHVSRDFFHPNELGYQVWAQALWPLLQQRAQSLRGNP